MKTDFVCAADVTTAVVSAIVYLFVLLNEFKKSQKLVIIDILKNYICIEQRKSF